MTPEQMQLLRDTAASDKGNVICIAILNLLQLVEDQKAKLDAIYVIAVRRCLHCDSGGRMYFVDGQEWECSACGKYSSYEGAVENIIKVIEP